MAKAQAPTSDADLKIVLETIWDEMHQEVFPAAVVVGKDLAEQHGDSVQAVVFYGSCLRAGSDQDKILDFYVLADDLADANQSKTLGFFNKTLPPNVFYREIEVEGRVVRSKYALMSPAAFLRVMDTGRVNTSFWARFSQPTALVWSKNAQAEAMVAEALVRAVVTATYEVAPTYDWNFTADELWSRTFELTYRAELRSEDATSKGRDVFREYDARYRQITGPALRLAGFDLKRGDGGRYGTKYGRGRVWFWRFRKAAGKLLSFLRLIKASMTFKGGIDYLAWKIRRHSGVDIEVTDWQRKHPLLGGLSLFFKTRRQGGFS